MQAAATVALDALADPGGVIAAVVLLATGGQRVCGTAPAVAAAVPAADAGGLDRSFGLCLRATTTEVDVVERTSKPSEPSVAGIVVRCGPRVVGALGIHTAAGGALTDEVLHRARVLAGALAPVLRDAPAPGTSSPAAVTRVLHHLQRSLRARAVISQATGVLMARHDVGPDQALAHLAAAGRAAGVDMPTAAEATIAAQARRAGTASDGRTSARLRRDGRWDDRHVDDPGDLEALTGAQLHQHVHAAVHDRIHDADELGRSRAGHRLRRLLTEVRRRRHLAISDTHPGSSTRTPERPEPQPVPNAAAGGRRLR